MSRQYNPVVAAYKNLQLAEPKSEPLKEQSKGLLSPKSMKEDKMQSQASEQPMSRVAKQVQDIRNRRMNLNGS